MAAEEVRRKSIEGQRIHDRKLIIALLCGILGCVFMGAGDWLMIYGSTAYHGAISWLTDGVAQIPAWRNGLAMFLAFPGIVLYSVALFSIASFLSRKNQRTIYRYLTALGMTPWLCIHLYYVMILYAFAWMNGSGYGTAALPLAEALQGQYAWLVMLGEAVMVLPFLYWFWLVLRSRSLFPQWMALSNPLLLYGILKLVTMLLPDSPFRLAFTNGLMSESMAIWFGTMILWIIRKTHRQNSPIGGGRGRLC